MLGEERGGAVRGEIRRPVQATTPTAAVLQARVAAPRRGALLGPNETEKWQKDAVPEEGGQEALALNAKAKTMSRSKEGKAKDKKDEAVTKHKQPRRSATAAASRAAASHAAQQS